MSAHVESQHGQGAGSARRATSVSTGRGRGSEKRTAEPLGNTNAATTQSGELGPTAGGSGLESSSQTSESSERPSNGSTRRWGQPRNAKQFAAQANRVATMILNGEIELDTARAYSGVARTMAQVLSAEVYRARFLQQEPNLSLEDEG